MICPVCHGTGVVKGDTKNFREVIKFMLEHGATFEEVAKTVHKSKSTVHYHAKKMGIHNKFREDLIKNPDAMDVIARKELL